MFLVWLCSASRRVGRVSEERQTCSRDLTGGDSHFSMDNPPGAGAVPLLPASPRALCRVELPRMRSCVPKSPEQLSVSEWSDFLGMDPQNVRDFPGRRSPKGWAGCAHPARRPVVSLQAEVTALQDLHFPTQFDAHYDQDKAVSQPPPRCTTLEYWLRVL